MLFHVTMKHTEDNCPVYHPDLQPPVVAATDKLEEVAKELGVKVHFFVVNAPDHVALALLEADSVNAIGSYVFSIPIVQDTKVVPVVELEEAMALTKAMLEQAQAEK